MRALVVEDDAALREQIIEVMKGAGFAVDAAANGTDGHFMAEEYAADIAIIDLGLPDGSGVAVVERLRDTQPDAQSVVVTIHDDEAATADDSASEA
mgnify:CR=1 FL=1